jgi:tryptophan 7-halogenase
MSETSADAFRASLARGEVSLQFGRTKADASGAEPVVVGTSRVTMSPATALRLRSRLREALQGAARRAAVSPQAAVSAMGTTPVNALPDDAGERATALFRAVDALGVDYLHERSFRLSPDTLLANRLLLSVGTRRLGNDAAARVLSVCDRLGLPGALRESVTAQVAASRSVHFGFEAGADGSLYKVYFERRDADAEAGRSAPGEPVLLHVAYKWNARNPARHVTTRYDWYPRLPGDALQARIREIFAGQPGPPLEAALEALRLAESRAEPDALQYLEVREEGNDRLSFDLNVYDARLTVKDAHSLLVRLRDHFAIRPGRFQALYDQIRAKPLGHFAGGVHRDGQPFVTVYYGVARRGDTQS